MKESQPSPFNPPPPASQPSNEETNFRTHTNIPIPSSSCTDNPTSCDNFTEEREPLFKNDVAPYSFSRTNNYIQEEAIPFRQDDVNTLDDSKDEEYDPETNFQLPMSRKRRSTSMMSEGGKR